MKRALGLICCVAMHSAAWAQPSPARFALVIGVNDSPDAASATLRYADDDAAQYAELFLSLGLDVTVLASLDADSRRLFPAIAGIATAPTRANLRSAVTAIAARVGTARLRGEPTTLYVVYAGHGNAKGGKGYLTLADARITGDDLRTQVLLPVAADQSHLVVDACYSFLLTARGPSGSKRPLAGFAAFGQPFVELKTGLVLSTSSATESHEWSAIGGGVFSYEIRSGLAGAADADGNGQITYQELDAFVTRANATVPNPRYRPDAFMQPAPGGDVLLDLRGQAAVEFADDGTQHVVIDDERGVRLAEFHRSPGHAVSLVRRDPARAWFVADRKTQAEWHVAAGTVAVNSATPRSQMAARGAESQVLQRLYELPFDQATVKAHKPRPLPSGPIWVPEPTARSRRAVVGWAVLGTAGVAGAVAGFELYRAHDAQAGIDRATSNAQVLEQNAKTRQHNRIAVIAGGAAGALAVTGALLIFWPDAPVTPTVGEHGVTLHYQARF